MRDPRRVSNQTWLESTELATIWSQGITGDGGWNTNVFAMAAPISFRCGAAGVRVRVCCADGVRVRVCRAAGVRVRVCRAAGVRVRVCRAAGVRVGNSSSHSNR